MTDDEKKTLPRAFRENIARYPRVSHSELVTYRIRGRATAKAGAATPLEIFQLNLVNDLIDLKVVNEKLDERLIALFPQ